ncbi:NUDIX hydrolase [candidate division KSB1 bacterium]|nr:NUDIX hydrolase [candidate division KSB1 bacterium]
MPQDIDSQWLKWAREIQALGQIGLTYCTNEYERERNQRLVEIAAEMGEVHGKLDKDVLLEHFNKQVGYATPKIDVRAAVIQDGNILLVQESADQRWCMPGGWADIGEEPSLAVEREVWEESGFKVKARKVIGVFDANRVGRPLPFYHAYKIVFLCDVLGGEATPSHETLDVRFFGFDNIPPLSRNRTNEIHLAEITEHLNNPQRATFFN